MPLSFRPYRGPEDLAHQYRIWTAATEGLPFAWRSTETNVRHISAHAPKFPGSRLFAERDGQVVGYIGTHDPFRWKTLGMAVPFGFPWTWPRDGALERELYDRMYAATPAVYAGQKIDFYIQRFRRSWTHHHTFFRERGWREAWADPIMTRPILPDGGGVIAGPGTAMTEGAFSSTAPTTPRSSSPPALSILHAERLTEAHIDEVVALAASDPTSIKPDPDAKAIRARFNDGWAEWEGAWIVKGEGPAVGDPAGAFAIEVRRPWAEVKMFYATPAGFERVVTAMDSAAAAAGAREVYFTIRPGGEARMAPLEKLGFRHVDDDVFVRRDGVMTS